VSAPTTYGPSEGATCDTWLQPPGKGVEWKGILVHLRARKTCWLVGE